MEILCFFAGVLFVYTKHAYPLLMLIITFLFRPKLRFLGWFSTAVIWSLCHQTWVSDQHMPSLAVIKKADLAGFVQAIPSQQGDKTQFQLGLRQLNGQAVKANLLLSCYQHCPVLRAGQYWSMQATLRKPRNLANPGGFDYLAWLKARHLSWTGTVKGSTCNLIETKRYFLLRLRQHLADMQARLNPNSQTLGIIQALTLGMTNHMTQDDWDLFRRTGTTHLMVISGAHIGLIAGLSYWLMKWIWCCCGRLCLYYPAPKMASIAALLMSCAYALLAGFGVPAQRSLIACSFVFIRHFCSCRFSVWQGWRYALLAVLLFEPHAVMMQGFYLSFLAVAILLLINQRLSLAGIKKIVAMQLACLFGLMPLSLYWFSYGAINGLMANLIAIPWVGFIIVPLSLLLTILGEAMAPSWLVMSLNTAINYLLKYLSLIDSFAAINLTIPLTEIVSAISMMLAMAVFLLMPLKQIYPAVILLLATSLFPAHEKMVMGDARIDVLDVGQGLAVVIKTAKHVVIYDTGAKFYRGGDMAKLAIIPYLRSQGIKHINTVIISHSDLDHRGGLSTLEKNYKIEELIVDNPSFYKRGSPCHGYPDWVWDGVSFRFFAIEKALTGKNNGSCVLQVATQAGQVLLTGDIEKIAENYLISTYGHQLASSILLAPHHGSKTSSSPNFVQQVAPRYAILSYGFNNRYHFPHQQALRVYQKQGISLYNTADCGMVSIRLRAQEQVSKPSCYRNN